MATLDQALDSKSAPIPQGKILDLEKIVTQIRTKDFFRIRGRVTESTSLIIQASVPTVRIGEMCYVTSGIEGIAPLKTEVVGFKGANIFLMPLGESKGLGPESEVVPTGKPFSIKCGYGLLGRVLNGVGEPMDGGEPLDKIAGLVDWSVDRECPDPYTRQPVDRPISMGVRAIDVYSPVLV